MKLIIRYFFKMVRVVMGPVMLLWERVTTPVGVKRKREAQQAIDEMCKALVLYQFRTCPFCIRVRREIRRLSLPIEFRDAQRDEQVRQELQLGGGKIQVPCLRIEERGGTVRWLFESDAINQYLKQRFS